MYEGRYFDAGRVEILRYASVNCGFFRRSDLVKRGIIRISHAEVPFRAMLALIVIEDAGE